ncbi:MAG: hypothetical protein AB8G95_06165 [Anaerolineae bacterium]
MRKRWLWFLLALVVLGGFFLFLRVDNLSNPSVDYDLNDPTVVSISQGTVGSVGNTRIGLKFVDGVSAGVSVIYSESDQEGTDLILVLGEAREINGELITLVDALPGRDTAIIQVVSASE